MGRKKSEDETKGLLEDNKEAEPEDTPLVKELKVLDDKYLALEREYEKERQELKRKYRAQQQPILDQRTALLIEPPAEAPASDIQQGTPALVGFWSTALKNHPAFEDCIEEWDEPVLEYLRNITVEDSDPTNSDAGFRLSFHFVENPYFTNTTLVKEYETVEDNPYTGDLDVKVIKSTEIDWKTGKDITVEKVAKKVKGGGAKKAKQKKEKAEPRESFFRLFFRTMEPGMEVPEDIELMGGMEMDEEDDDEDVINFLMENDHDNGLAIKDSIIPFAVRWYTGEAAPERDDDDDDEDSEEEEDEDESEEDSEEDEPQPKRKGGGQAKKGGKPAKSSPKVLPKASDDKDAPKEECKQQ